MRPATRKRTSILLTCILTAALLFGAFTVIANAADIINPSGDPLGYRLKSDNTLAVLGFHDAPVGTDLVIPGVVEYEGETYSIYRKYEIPGTDYTELYFERKGGTNGQKENNG